MPFREVSVMGRRVAFVAAAMAEGGGLEELFGPAGSGEACAGGLPPFPLWHRSKELISDRKFIFINENLLLFDI